MIHNSFSCSWIYNESLLPKHRIEAVIGASEAKMKSWCFNDALGKDIFHCHTVQYFPFNVTLKTITIMTDHVAMYPASYIKQLQDFCLLLCLCSIVRIGRISYYFYFEAFKKKGCISIQKAIPKLFRFSKRIPQPTRQR